MMTSEQANDIEDKKNILINIDINNSFHHEFATIMLIKGFGYTSEKLKNGVVEKSFGGNKDFHYYCEIGKLIEKYLPEPYKYDLAKTKVIDTTEEIFQNQIVSCAENILFRLKLSEKILKDSNSERSVIMKKELEYQIEKCKIILNGEKQ